MVQGTVFHLPCLSKPFRGIITIPIEIMMTPLWLPFAAAYIGLVKGCAGVLKTTKPGTG